MKKMMSLILALSLVFALSIPAVAAEKDQQESADATAVSHFAGTTVPCQIVKCSDEGEPVTSIVDVTIPEGATVAEQNRLVQAAVLEDAGVSQADAARGVMDLISTEKNLRVVSNMYTQVGAATIPAPDYITLAIQFENYGNYGGKNLTVVVKGGKNPSRSHSMTTQLANGPSIIVSMYNGMDNVFLTEGSNITVSAKTDAGYMTVQTCNVWISPWEMGVAT
ncbi:MAG: hypothetical protein MR419_04895 [Clostridiales bacterium]|nr:hypothetical protein [Clostridiales bacterium]MDY4171414.1 hypothetical protein [Evtepia sp.]